MNGEEGGQRGAAVSWGAEEMTGSVSARCAAAAAAGRGAGCLAGGRVIQAFARFSLLLTLVGILQRIIPSQGGR